MNNQNPIISFNPRENDSGRTPGSGGGDKPKWVLEGKELTKRVLQLTSEIEDIDTGWDFNEEYGIPKALEIEFSENAKAKTHQSKIIELFTINQNNKQIGMSSEYSLIMKSNSSQELEAIKTRLNDIDKNDVQISAIQSVSEFEPSFKTKNGTSKYKLSLLDFLDSKENTSTLEYITEELQKNNITFTVLGYGSKKVIELKESNLDKLNFVRTLPIKSVEPMEETHPFRFTKLDIEIKNTVSRFDVSKTYPTVGLLDSGVAINTYTEGWVTHGEGSIYSTEQLDTNHGTYIASLLIHGDMLNGVSDSSIQGCNVVEVPIVPNFPINGPQLISNIERAISSNIDVKIWNLSVSLGGEIQEDRFSDFSTELDRIQDTYNVLILKSAGNDPSFYQGGEAGKLSTGAESVRSLTVGAINRNLDSYNYSIPGYPSPYSRKGRGPASIVKPELSFYGGDVFSIVNDPACFEDFEINGEKGIDANGNIIQQVGTSFSTPKVAKLAAEIALLLDYDEFNPILIKALLIHSATYSENLFMGEEEKIEKLGFGKPNQAPTILVTDDTSSTLLLEGTLEKGKNIDILDFPFPQNLVENGKFKGRLTATLVYNPYLESELGAEYCQSNLVLRLGTYDEQTQREGRFAIFNPIKREGSKNILRKGLYSKKKMLQNAQFGPERIQIEYGDKYYPVKKYRCDLNELLPSTEEFIHSDKRWFLFLEGQYRDFITKKLSVLNNHPSMKYCLLITITDPDSNTDVHSGVVQSLEQLNFNYNTMETNVNVNVDSKV